MHKRVSRVVATGLFVVMALVVARTIPAQAGDPKPHVIELKTDDSKSLYALGLAISRNLSTFGLTAAELDFVKAELGGGVLDRKRQVDLEQVGPKIDEMARVRTKAAAAVEQEKGRTFLAKAAAAPGAKKTASGLVITEITAGTGASPKPTDTVSVHDHGTLLDGTVFDSSVQRGQPAEFPLNGVVPCWTEGVQLMKVGGKRRLICPADIAYGDRGSPPKIKPGHPHL